MRTIKAVIFLVILSLTFQGLASYSFCDIAADQDTSAMISSMMMSDQHDCCDDNSNTKDQCQCSAAIISVLPENGLLSLDYAMNAFAGAIDPELYSISPPNIFHPPRLS